jgi:hypothetical protein
MPRFGLTAAEERSLKRLDTPSKIQDFLNTLPFHSGDARRSPRGVLRDRTANCMEGALLAALALRLRGKQPLIVDIESAPHDDDHVIAVFKEKGKWGAVSKTNHNVLRYRDPVYASIRELAMSYFHEYTDRDGIKTMRTYSQPVDLSRFDARGWTTTDDIQFIVDYLIHKMSHRSIISSAQAKKLRSQDAIERRAGKLIEWDRAGRRVK